MNRFITAIFCAVLASCASAEGDRPFSVEAVASFEEPWAMTFLPDGRLLVTEKVRGLGAQPVNKDGQQFVYPLEPRDVEGEDHEVDVEL